MAASHVETQTPPLDWLGLGAAVLGAALFSTKPIFIKFAYADNVDALALLTMRMICALPFYLTVGFFAFRRTSGPVTGKLVLAIVANGLMGYYLASYLDFKGLEEISAQLERLILFTYPIFVVLIGAAFFHQPLAKWTIPALLMAYSGLALVFVGNMDHPGTGNIYKGAAMVLGAAFSFSLFQLFGRELVRQIGSVLYTSIAMTSASLGVTLHFAVLGDPDGLAVPPKIWAIALGIAVIATVVPSYLINYALGRVGAASTAMAGNAGPLFTIALAATVLAEPFGWREAAGTALVIGAMVLFTRK